MEQVIVTHVDNTTLKLQSRENRSSITKFVQNVELLGTDVVDITVESATKLNFYIGDKITVIGRDYTLNTPPVEKKYSESSFVYDLQFEGVQYDLMRAAYSVNVDTTTNQIQDLNGEALTGDLKMFLDVLISNVSRVFPGKWVLGTYPENTETRTEVFGETDNCLSVLQSLCGEDKYNTEFSIEIGVNGVRTLNIGATGSVFPYTFEYGRGKGAYELTRERISSSNIITRLNVFGSTKNIMTSKYRASRLCLPTKSKSQSYIEDAAAIAKFGVWENTKIFEEVYPHRTGTISAVDDHLTFRDSSMDFDLNAKDGSGNSLYLVSGTSAKISVKTGNLAGYEFELTNYDHATKQFKVKQQIDENGYKFPSDSTAAFQFEIGDEYTIIDIFLPQSYVDAAEAELATKGGEYLTRYKQPNVQYSISEVDPFFLSRIVGAEVESNIIWVGDYIPVKDSDLEIDKTLRVKSFTRDLLKDYSYSLAVAEHAVGFTTISRIVSEVRGIDNIMRINNLVDPARARRNWLSAQEVLNMVFDPEGDFYTEKIKPLSIETTMLSVGAKSMQFGLVGTVFQPTYGGAKNRVVYTGGVLTHYAILDGSGDPRVWNISDGDVVLGTDAAYYIYAKCHRTESGGSMLFSTTKILSESDPVYYHFLIGVINSVDENNARALALMYGFTTINGRFVKTGRVTSTDGLTYFDLDTGVISGKISFQAGSSGYGNLSDKPDLSVYSLQADVNALVSNLQSQIDGQIMTWFDTYVPTLSNAPATSWATDAEKDKHLGDLFYNKSTGLGYRFSKTLTVYSWEILKDTDVALALANAATAQDTADGKRRVFVAQPTNSDAYDVGDLWVNATYSTTYTNELLRCKTAKAAGVSFSIAHWEKASKYTDDTVAQNALQDADEALTNAANAQTAANNANSLLADIASDSKLTPVEKSSVRAEWDIIAAEKSVNDTQANTFGITTEKTTYGTKFQALANYLNNGTTWSSGVPSWIADANLGATTNIVGATFRLTFKEYYDARTALLNAIAVKAKQLADEAQNTADNISVGARNLVSSAMLWAWNSKSATYPAIVSKVGNYWLVKQNWLYTAYGSSAMENIFPNVSFEPLTQYVLSVDWQALGLTAGQNGMYLRFYYDNATVDEIVINNDDGRKVSRMVSDAGKTISKVSVNYGYVGAGTAIYKIQLEKGNKASDWAQAPEDTAVNMRSKAPALENWNLMGQSIIPITDGKEGLTVLRMALTTYPSAGIYIPVDTARKYKVRFWARASSDCNGKLYFSLRQFKNMGVTPCDTNNGRSPYYPSAQTAHTNWVYYEKIWQAADFQTGVTYVLPEFLGNYQGTAGYWEVQGFEMVDLTETVNAQVTADAAQTGVNALNYLKTAMQGSTDITGGLLATNVLLMKTLAGVITAGLSGLSNDNIAFWGGGTYQDALDAIAKIILRKDGSGQFAGGKILFTNDGDLSVGALGIDANGNLIIKDSGNVNRVLLTKNDITTLSAIESSTQNTTVNNAYNEFAGEGTQTNNLANTITVNNNNSEVSVVCNLNSSITDNTIEGDSEASAYIQLLLVNTVSGASIQIDSLSTHRYSSDVNNSKSVNESVVVPAGTYQLRVSYTHTDYGNCSFASYISASTTTVFYDGAVQRTELGKNGFGIIGSALNYSFFGMEGGVFKAVEKVSSSGVYDKPGVLASASVSSTGTSTKKWGAKTGNSTKPSTGTYTISHTIGHTDYTVQITPLTSARVGYISAKNSTSVTIVMTNMSGTATDTAFDYLITGNNQATT